VATGTYNLVYFMGGAVSVAIAGAILRNRESASDAWNPVYRGHAPAYSDAMTVVLAYALVGIVLALLVTRPAANGGG
jgi:hypothetical protein